MNPLKIASSATFRNLRLSICASVFWIAFAATDLRAQTSAPGWTPQRKQPPAEKQTVSEMARRGQSPLSRLRPEIKIEATALRSLPALSPAQMRQERKSQRLRIGAIRSVSDPIDTLAEMTAFAEPTSRGRLHIARVISKDALSVRLHFTNVALPKGARLFVYSLNDSDNFHGPYESHGPNGNGEFWTPPIMGDGAVIEYFSPDAASNVAAPFRVTQLSHAYIDERVAIPGAMSQQGPGACNNAVPAQWSEAAKSVARLRFIEPQGEFLCTGTWLNTTDNSGKPYILTANHCFSTQSAAITLAVTWLYDSGDDPSVIGSLPSNHGSYLLATGARSDFTLVELRTPVPNGVRFSGWTTQAIAPGTTVASIHHPFGSYKRFSSGATVAADCPQDLPGQLCDSLLKVQWSSGVTEPGSSGGPLFVGDPSDPRLAGALFGGISSCANRSGIDFFSRFDLTFEAIRFYLTGEGCAYDLSASERLAPAAGGALNIGVNLREGDACAWSASSTTPWIKITGAAGGQGDGQISYEVEPNPTTQTRFGFLIIADQTLAIAQPGVDNNCAPSPLTPGQPVSASLSTNDCRSVIDESVYADRYTFSGNAGQQITISLQSTQFDGFLTLLDSSGAIIAQNDDAPFYGGARIPAAGPFVLPADDVYTVEATSVDANAVGGYTLDMKFTGCSHVATLETTKFGHFGGSGRLVVRTEGGGSCNWPVGATRPWLSPPSVSFAGTVPPVYNGEFVIFPHGGAAPRTGVINIAGFPFTVSQYPSCNAARPATLSATDVNLNGFGGQFTLNVTVPPARLCSWGVSGPLSENGISIESGFNGLGSGEIKFSYLPNNTLNVRTTTISVAGQTVTLRQAPAGGACQSRPIEVGQTINGSLAAGDCGSPSQPGDFSDHYSFNAVEREQVAIIVTSNDFAPAISVIGPNGDTNGVVTNPPGSTSNEVRLPAEGYMDLYLAGKYTFVVTSRDAGRRGNYSIRLIGAGGPGCGYLTSPSNIRIPGAGGTGSLNLTVQNNCPWTAKSDSPWITFPKDHGSGGGAIEFTVAPNPGARRRAVVSVANRYTEIVQDAQCSFLEVTPQKFFISARRGGFSAAVSTGAGCNWTVSSQSDWIKVTGVMRGDDINGVTFSVEENTGNVRVGAVEIGGRSYEVRQGAGNLPTVSSASFTAPIAPGGISTVFGEELATRTEFATTLPLSQSLGGARVTIYDGRGNGRDSLLFFASPRQINYLVDPDSFPGEGVVQVFNDTGMYSLGKVVIERVAPGLFSASSDGQGVAAAVALRIKADKSQTYEPVSIFDQSQNKFVTLPIDLGPDLGSASDQVFLILFGTGLRNISSLSAASAQIGGENAEVLFAGAQGGLFGLDQVNMRLPRSLAGRGVVDIVMTVDGKTANTVSVNVK